MQRQYDKHVERGDEHAGQKRQAEQKLQCHSRAQDLGEVAGGDGDFAQHPKNERNPSGILFTASLRQIATRGDAQLRRERLQNHCHEIAQENDAEQRVAKF